LIEFEKRKGGRLSDDALDSQPLMDWLTYNGFTVVTKLGKEFVEHTVRRKVKGNINVELARRPMSAMPAGYDGHSDQPARH
jgi:uncharacterized LabA/DUF88 family protein